MPKLKSAPAFTDYPEREIYKGKHAEARTGNGVGQPHPDGGYLPSMFRTRLIEAARSGNVNFAGHYILTIWGCGSGGCREGAIIDAKNRDVFWLPAVECCWGGDGFFVDKNSRLFVISTKSGQDLSAEAEELLNKRRAAGLIFLTKIFYPLRWITFTSLDFPQFTKYISPHV